MASRQAATGRPLAKGLRAAFAPARSCSRSVLGCLLQGPCGCNEVPWRGRAFDLQDAYRQLAIAPAHRTHSFICVYEPMHGPRCYRMLTMPFGSSASVYAFLRTSLAIHALGARLFRLPWTCFYDDFPTVVPEPLANAATRLIRSLFTLLGFQVSDKPSKNPPFAAVFQALGVCGVFEVANTEARIHLLASSLQELLTSHSLSPKEARRLRGRMQFAHGQLSGRYPSRCLSSLHELSALAPGSRAPPSLVRILQRCLQSLVISLPRAVSPTEVNVTDAPSRGDETQLLFFRSQKSHVTPSIWNSLWSELQL